MFKNIISKGKFVLGRGELYLKKFAPEILVGVGIATMAGAVVVACKQSMKADEILDKHAEDMDKIEKATEKSTREEYTEKDIKRDKAIVYRRTIVDFAKLYLPVAGLFAVGTVSILVGFNKMKKRYLVVSSLYALEKANHKETLKKIAERYGKEEADNIKYSLTADEVIETAEDGTETSTLIPHSNGGYYSPYARIFDESNQNYSRENEENRWWLQSQQDYFNFKLRTKGHVFLNEVYDKLGFPRTGYGQYVGWLKDGDGDGEVDFGLFDIYSWKTRDFVNGYEPAVILDFNVDGVIVDKI